MSLQSGLSVIVLTSPGRERNLEACLKSLVQQEVAAQQIIVIDDGSGGGKAVLQTFQSQLPLQYHWRPNDFRLAYSRNLGARQAKYNYLIFLDSDMVLNPRALGYYQAYAQGLPHCAIYGYHGNVDQAIDLYDSRIVANWKVHAEDQRFPWLPEQGLSQHPHLQTRPADFAWSANFAMSQQVFGSVHGFDQERFVNWGYEDLDLAYRLQNQGVAIHFSLDVWAEASPHPSAWGSPEHKNRNQSLITPVIRDPQPVQILHDRKSSGLWQSWQQHSWLRSRRHGTQNDFL